MQRWLPLAAKCLLVPMKLFRRRSITESVVLSCCVSIFQVVSTSVSFDKGQHNILHNSGTFRSQTTMERMSSQHGEGNTTHESSEFRNLCSGTASATKHKTSKWATHGRRTMRRARVLSPETPSQECRQSNNGVSGHHVPCHIFRFLRIVSKSGHFEKHFVFRSWGWSFHASGHHCHLGHIDLDEVPPSGTVGAAPTIHLHHVGVESCDQRPLLPRWQNYLVVLTDTGT